MSSDSGLGNHGFGADNILAKDNDTTMADTGTDMSAFVPYSAENSAPEKSVDTVKSNMEASTLENFTTENFTTENFTTENSTTEKSCTNNSFTTKPTTENPTAEKSNTDESVTQESPTVNFTLEEPTAEELTTEESSTESNPDSLAFAKLSPEICNKILKYVLSDQSDPSSEDGQKPLTKTLNPPAIIWASKVLRETALAMYYRGREFSIQVPEDEDRRNKVEGLQTDLMTRWNQPRYTKLVKEQLEEAAEEVADKVEECLEGLECMDSVYYSHIESIYVWSGRFRINRVGFGWNWAPRSCIVGFKAFAGPPRPGQVRNKHRRINVNGDLDWSDFNLVRRLYAMELRRDCDFAGLEWVDVLLHPSVQYIVRELCLLGAAGAPAMEWVEVMLEEWTSWSARDELGMPPHEPDAVDELSPLPSATVSPLTSEDEWEEEDEEEEEEEEEPEEESEEEPEHESEDEMEEFKSAFPDAGDESQD